MAAARGWACEQATRCGWGALCDVVELLISEIATNVVRHTRSATFVVRLHADGEPETVVCDTSTADPGCARPRTGTKRPGAGTGPGQPWPMSGGTQQLPDANGVWFRLRTHQT